MTPGRPPRSARGRPRAEYQMKDGKPVIPLYDLTSDEDSEDGGVLGAASQVVRKILQVTKDDPFLKKECMMDRGYELK